jgi:DNA polymerase III subunit epsilon
MTPDELSFVALDFETATHAPESACAVALVRVVGGRIVERSAHLIRPDDPEFAFTWVHGITWEHVAEAPPFAEVWNTVQPMLEGAPFLAAHNAPFDRGVLHACCYQAGLSPPDLPFRCTVALARRTWRLPSARLPVVCSHLGIPLHHHDPLSDAEACARILLAAAREGAVGG